MSCSLAGIIIMQVFWIKQAVRLKEEQFDRSVNEAMTNVVDRLGKQKTASLLANGFRSVSYPVNQASSSADSGSSERKIIHNRDIRKVVSGNDTITREVNEISFSSGPLYEANTTERSLLQPSA